MKSLILVGLVGLCMFYSGSTAPQNNNGNEVCIPATSLASRLPEFTGKKNTISIYSRWLLH